MFLVSLLCAFLAIVPLHSADQSFLESAVKNEAQVVSLSMLALQKSSAPAMRSLAADLLAHHGAIGRALDGFLGESAYKIPQTGFARDGSHLQELAALGGDEFNTTILREMASLVDRRAKLFDEAAKRHGNLNVRTLARDMIAELEQDAYRVHVLDERAQVARL